MCPLSFTSPPAGGTLQAASFSNFPAEEEIVPPMLRVVLALAKCHFSYSVTRFSKPPFLYLSSGLFGTLALEREATGQPTQQGAGQFSDGHTSPA